MIAELFGQLERFRVERYKRLPNRTWAWVTIGDFNAASMKEARDKGRAAIADKVCILRAVRIGNEPAAPEGVML